MKLKHFFLTAALAATAFGTATGQSHPTPKSSARPVAMASAAAAAEPAVDEESPKYAGFYINGKLATEINCYGVDELALVYPFFSALDACDRFIVTMVAGSYDSKGKFTREYLDVSAYDQGSVTNIRSKFANKGYGVITRSGLVDAFNQHRNIRPSTIYEVGESSPAFDILKYTELDSSKVAYSAIYFEIVTHTFNGSYSSQGDPQYSANLLYVSPKIKLKNRVNTARVGAKSSVAKKGLAFVPLVGVVANAVKEKPLPEMQNESCAPVGPGVTLMQAKKVLRDQIGEEVTTN